MKNTGSGILGPDDPDEAFPGKRSNALKAARTDAGKAAVEAAMNATTLPGDRTPSRTTKYAAIQTPKTSPSKYPDAQPGTA